jgi:hypothetical protein
VVGLSVSVDGVFDELAGKPDDEEQKDAGDKAGQRGLLLRNGVRRVRRIRLAQVGKRRLDRPRILLRQQDLSYQVTDLMTPKRTKSARASERTTAQVSSERMGFLAGTPDGMDGTPGEANLNAEIARWRYAARNESNKTVRGSSWKKLAATTAHGRTAPGGATGMYGMAG